MGLASQLNPPKQRISTTKCLLCVDL